MSYYNYIWHSGATPLLPFVIHCTRSSLMDFKRDGGQVELAAVTAYGVLEHIAKLTLVLESGTLRVENLRVENTFSNDGMEQVLLDCVGQLALKLSVRMEEE